MVEKRGDFLFECSWEVCNKVGGIFTVVSSKAAQMQNVYGEGYFLVGPYFPDKLAGQFQECVTPDVLKGPFSQAEQQGITCHFGKWLVEGEPQVILLDTTNYWGNLDSIKKQLWEQHHVDSLRAGYDYDEPIVWSHASGVLIDAFGKHCPDKKVVGHFHEWLSGAGLLHLRSVESNVRTVFTTHATTLGRVLANSNEDLYAIMDKIDSDQSAHDHQVESKHTLEKASAQGATIFTTVSEITGLEAEHFLGRKPDVLLPNGLDIEKFPVVEELVFKHKMQRNKIREFVLSYFFPYYCFDIEDTLFYFIAARYEYRAKGIDLYIESLSKLNQRLKEEGSSKTIVAFFFVPSHVKNVKSSILENKTNFQDVKDSIVEERQIVEERLLQSFIEGRKITEDFLLDKPSLSVLKKKVARFKKQGNPPVMTHDLFDAQDPIAHRLHEVGLQNAKEDNVKVVMYPIYLSGADGLLDLDYYETMQGCHLGVFPSYYEPWGYTPVEAGALGVTSVTTDLSGFGRYFCAECHQGQFPGIYVVKRLHKNEEETKNLLFDVLYSFSQFNREQRTKNKLEARRVAGSVDWKFFVEYYVTAHNRALES